MNAKEKMKIYLEKLRNMESEEVEKLKKDYKKFSLEYESFSPKKIKIGETTFVGFEMDEEYLSPKNLVGQSNIFNQFNFDEVSLKTEESRESCLDSTKLAA